MKSLGLLTAGVAAAVIMATAPLVGATAPQHHDRSLASQVRSLRSGIEWHRTKTWHLQDELGVGRTPSSHAERRTRSVPFLRWINRLWLRRQIRAKHVFAAHRLPPTGDWQTAIRIVQRDWPGTAAWMLSCSAHEGGHGIWVWNGGAPYSSPNHGSGAGGWMQFMQGTFDGQYRSAIALARQEHLALPSPEESSWTSPIGQAFAAGWAYSHARAAWTGDPYCY